MWSLSWTRSSVNSKICTWWSFLRLNYILISLAQSSSNSPGSVAPSKTVMASGEGFGRGGRGAALLQALAQRSKKPGQMEEEEKKKAPAEVAQIAAGRAALPQTKADVPMGRGSLLAGLRQSMLAKQGQPDQVSPTLTEPQQQKPDPPQMAGAAAGDAPPKPLGRGLAAMRALMSQQSQQQTSQSPTSVRAPLLMGRGHFTHPQQSASSQAGTSSESEGHSSSEPPTEAMSKMSVTAQTQEPRHPGERPRRPTITKIGTEGTPSSLSANYVRLLCKNHHVYQYHVSFCPIIDNRRLKAGLLAQHRERFKTISSFDGNILYLPYKLPDAETVVTSKRNTDGSVITLTVSFIKAVPPEQCCHLYNVVFRKIMHILEMCQVGRYYYNPHTPALVPQYKLEVWPGYITAIKEHEGGLLLLLDASHRVLRTQTVLEIMESDVLKNPEGFQEAITRKMVGSTVLTRYNNKTYRIDDIVWSKNPLHKFDCKATGESMSFEEYYRKQHNIEIKNKSQPLLLHKRKPPKGAPGFEPTYIWFQIRCLTTSAN
ncbi:piwi-like protein 2 [Plakobranchus ocellatus]|uniref:Piwi-like protein 2 n=1 Tax=Plakobranchus ocellatus TaxID=259542 RepID=A0AAV3Y6J6_9GAST|nr:piwi-like protein 2 [Plakobranchus ocellatus]